MENIYVKQLLYLKGIRLIFIKVFQKREKLKKLNKQFNLKLKLKLHIYPPKPQF